MSRMWFYEGVRERAGDPEQLLKWLEQQRREFSQRDHGWMHDRYKRWVFPFYDQFSLVKVPLDVLSCLHKHELTVYEREFPFLNVKHHDSLLSIAEGLLWNREVLKIAKPEWAPDDPLAELLWLQEAGVNLSQEHPERQPFPAWLLEYAGSMNGSLIRRILGELKFSFTDTCSYKGQDQCVMSMWLDAYHRFLTRAIEEGENRETTEAALWELFEKVNQEHRTYSIDKCQHFFNTYARNMDAFRLDVYRKLVAHGYDPFTPIGAVSHMARLVIIQVGHPVYIETADVRVLLKEALRLSKPSQWHRVCDGPVLDDHEQQQSMPLVTWMLEWNTVQHGDQESQDTLQYVLRHTSIEELEEERRPFRNRSFAHRYVKPIVTALLANRSGRQQDANPAAIRLLLENGVSVDAELFKEVMSHEKTPGATKELLRQWARGQFRVRRSWSNMIKWPWVAHLKENQSPFYGLPRDLLRYMVDFLYWSGSLEAAVVWLK